MYYVDSILTGLIFYISLRCSKCCLENFFRKNLEHYLKTFRNSGKSFRTFRNYGTLSMMDWKKIPDNICSLFDSYPGFPVKIVIFTSSNGSNTKPEKHLKTERRRLQYFQKNMSCCFNFEMDSQTKTSLHI